MNNNDNDSILESEDIEIKEIELEKDLGDIEDLFENKKEEFYSDFIEEEEDFAPTVNKNVKIIRYKKKNKLAFGLVFTSLILGISVILSVTILYLGKEILGIDKSTSFYAINIPEGSTVDDIIKIMTIEQKKKNLEPIVKVPLAFKAFVKIGKSESEFVPGDHNISPSMGYSEIVSELTSREIIEKEKVDILFEEGITLDEAAKKLEENLVCKADDFIELFNARLNSYNFEAYLPDAKTSSLKYQPMEGYLFPDTYQFYKATSNDIASLTDADYEIIIRKVYEHFNDKFTQQYIDRAKELNMSIDEVITLASLIQKEAANNDQMKDIASVFHNRLNNRANYPRLDSDTTNEYIDIMKAAGVTDTTQLEAYDTYKSAGLPPGAISNPGLPAIEAALYPNETPYLFFCHNTETGEVFYAETLEQHYINQQTAGLLD